MLFMILTCVQCNPSFLLSGYLMCYVVFVWMFSNSRQIKIYIPVICSPYFCNGSKSNLKHSPSALSTSVIPLFYDASLLNNKTHHQSKASQHLLLSLSQYLSQPSSIIKSPENDLHICLRSSQT